MGISFSLRFKHSTTRYTPAARMRGHREEIHTLAISPDGKHLISGGEYQYSTKHMHILNNTHTGSDGARFWDLTFHREMPAPYHTRLLDPVNVAAWLTVGDNFVACYGTRLGYLVFCKRDPDQVCVCCCCVAECLRCLRIDLTNSSPGGWERECRSRLWQWGLPEEPR